MYYKGSFRMYKIKRQTMIYRGKILTDVIVYEVIEGCLTEVANFEYETYNDPGYIWYKEFIKNNDIKFI